MSRKQPTMHEAVARIAGMTNTTVPDLAVVDALDDFRNAVIRDVADALHARSSCADDCGCEAILRGLATAREDA